MIVREEIGELTVGKLINRGTGTRGTAAAGVTNVLEKGDGVRNVTVLTVNTTLGAIATGTTAATDLGLGKLLYTLPAGDILVEGAYIDVAMVAQDGFIDADTPEVGLGTSLASGAVSVLSGGFENIVEGQVATDCSGTDTTVVTGTTSTTIYPLPINSGNPHTVYLNVADGWAASGEAACPISGTVTLMWTKLN